MYYYKFAEGMNQESLNKLLAQAPSQAAAVLLAVWEIGANTTEVTEDQVIDRISADLKRFSPRAKNESVVPGFCAYYRSMLGALPAHIMTQRKDNLGGKSRGGSRGGGAETITDPITGEAIANPFKRAPVKNPGSRKTRKIVTEEFLDDGEESDESEVPFDDVPGDIAGDDTN